jgi:glucosamine kinase
MDLLVDSGSTKTLWTMVQQGAVLKQLKTEGINPYVHSAERILNLVQEKVLPELIEIPEHVHFYGAGCSTSANIAIVEAALQSMSDQMQVNVHHDLLAVARALCRHQPGIAVILGTGSNSCLYDGNSIVQHTPSLGDVLGDEGSGSYIAKQIIADIYHGIAPSSIMQSYHEYFDESLEEMLHSVYKEHSANAFLASKMPWVSTQLKEEYILDIIESSIMIEA